MRGFATLVGAMTETVSATRAQLRSRLMALGIRDEHRLARRLARANTPQHLAALSADFGQAEAWIANRRNSVPAVTYPESLPVSVRRDDIAAAIAAHQVVIVAGETGSGKTTQLPKICLDLGRGVRGTIGHTQPRRLAARTVAERIAEELGSDLGAVVGYTVRFTAHATENTLVKLMTDGILLAEIQRDPLLRAYDTIIIDEAHERSLNIDFLLGYLKQLLPRRPDLKIVITSATIDPELFARHFAGPDGTPAPIVEVSGRSYPVEIRYRPLTVVVGDELVDRDPIDAVGEAVRELFASGDGDVLVFLSGEREIRDTADALRDLRLPRTEIVPLYARLSAAEQHRVFTAHTGRRVVLATNVAETSLTVPGIRYVIDPGTARISRYSVRTKVQRLPIEPISQASARQRAGRCGRVADGICIRLYSEDDFAARPAFTEPEILRTSLASVVLRMTALKLGDIAEFPFVEPPDPRSIRDGIALLTELGAITPGGGALTLTPVGRELAQLPVDPRMARMLVQGNREGCLAETLIIVSALSIQDVRERPTEHQQAADTKHARFTVDGSDFLAYLQLWSYLDQQRKTLSSSQFRRMCREEFLHWLRIREWQDLHGQLRSIAQDLSWNTKTTVLQGDMPFREVAADTPTATPATGAAGAAATIHRTLLAGMLSHIGVREAESREFLGARGAKFVIFPGSSLARKPPRWVMAAELVETSRLWGRMAGRIEPEWAEKLAGDLVKRTYSEPHWSSRRLAAMAYERVTLYGVPLVTRRPVDYARVDPVAARELFIRHALVGGEWQTRHEFFHRNRDLLADAAELEHRARRRDIIADDEELFAFYDARVPAEVVSARHFDTWWRKTAQKTPGLLDFSAATVVRDTAAGELGVVHTSQTMPSAPGGPALAVLARDSYPDMWRQGDLRLRLTYQFEPGTADDGVTVHIPLAQLAQVRNAGFDWLVPGMRTELAAALIKTLPKHLRRAVVPAPDFAAAAMAELTARTEPLRTGLARELTRLGSAPISAADFGVAALPDHLRMTFAAVDASGSVLARNKSLSALKDTLAKKVSQAVAHAVGDNERPPAREWTPETLGTLATVVHRDSGGQTVTGYPALAVTGNGVAVKVFSSAAAQEAAMQAGTRELVCYALPVTARAVTAGLTTADRLALSQQPYPTTDEFIADCQRCAAGELIAAAGGPVRDPGAFAELVQRIRPDLFGRTAVIVRLTIPVLAAATACAGLLATVADSDIAADARTQLQGLVFPGFISDVGSLRLAELPRYLTALRLRLDALPASVPRDHAAMDILDRVTTALSQAVRGLPPARQRSAAVIEVHWMIEELRVSLYAQQLGTRGTVSEKRVLRAIDTLR